MADPRHRSGYGRSQGKPGVRGCGPVDEQPPRVRAHHRPDPTPRLGQTERPQSEHVLARDPQRLSARNQDPQSGSAVEELSHDTPDRCRQDVRSCRTRAVGAARRGAPATPATDGGRRAREHRPRATPRRPTARRWQPPQPRSQRPESPVQMKPPAQQPRAKAGSSRIPPRQSRSPTARTPTCAPLRQARARAQSVGPHQP